MAALLEYGADVAAVDNVGSTALHYASSWGNLKSFRLLVEYGASPMKKNNVGATPTDYALNGQTAMFCRGMVAEYLRQRRQNGEQVDEEEEEEHLQQQPEVNLDWQAGLDDLDEFMREQRELTPNSSEETNSDEFVEARSTSPSKPSMNGGSMRLVDGNVAYEDDDLTPMSNRKMKFPDLDEMMDGYDESD